MGAPGAAVKLFLGPISDASTLRYLEQLLGDIALPHHNITQSGDWSERRSISEQLRRHLEQPGRPARGDAECPPTTNHRDRAMRAAEHEVVAGLLRLDVPAVQARGDALRDDRDRVGSAGLAVCGSSLIAAELVRVDGVEYDVGRR